MADEVTPSNQEKLLENQLRIAESMKVKPEILEILKKVEAWQKREWLYICALDGMPVEQIRALQESRASTLKIRKAKQEFISEKYAQTDLLQKNVESLQKEVQSAFRESREARSAIENGLEEALRKQAQAQEETIRTKDKIIEMLNLRVAELESRKLQEKEKQDEKMQMTDGEDHSVRKHQEWRTKTEKITEPEITNPETDPVADVAENTAQALRREKKGLLSLLVAARKDSDTKRFIDRYIKDDSITPEQKEFLLDCLEEGMDIKEIGKFAAPGLSVAVMQRLKNLQMKD